MRNDPSAEDIANLEPDLFQQSSVTASLGPLNFLTGLVLPG